MWFKAYVVLLLFWGFDLTALNVLTVIYKNFKRVCECEQISKKSSAIIQRTSSFNLKQSRRSTYFLVKNIKLHSIKEIRDSSPESLHDEIWNRGGVIRLQASDSWATYPGLLQQAIVQPVPPYHHCQSQVQFHDQPASLCGYLLRSWVLLVHARQHDNHE